jgi:hypothetical protein
MIRAFAREVNDVVAAKNDPQVIEVLTAVQQRSRRRLPVKRQREFPNAL